MAKRNDGWAVYRDERDGDLVLYPHPGQITGPYALVAWTVGSRRDGQRLLARIRRHERLMGAK